MHNVPTCKFCIVNFWTVVVFSVISELYNFVALVVHTIYYTNILCAKRNLTGSTVQNQATDWKTPNTSCGLTSVIKPRFHNLSPVNLLFK